MVWLGDDSFEMNTKCPLNYLFRIFFLLNFRGTSLWIMLNLQQYHKFGVFANHLWTSFSGFVCRIVGRPELVKDTLDGWERPTHKYWTFLKRFHAIVKIQIIFLFSIVVSVLGNIFYFRSNCLKTVKNSLLMVSAKINGTYIKNDMDNLWKRIRPREQVLNWDRLYEMNPNCFI